MTNSEFNERYKKICDEVVVGMYKPEMLRQRLQSLADENGKISPESSVVFCVSENIAFCEELIHRALSEFLDFDE